jgi:hypothetical protein
MYLMMSALFTFATDATCRATDPLESCNVVWDSPSADQNGSMPIGNGDIAANVWMEPGGELVLLLSKTDAWNENADLLKLGRVRLSLSPSPVAEGTRFKQTLHLRQGEIVIAAGEGDKAVAIRIWVDANQPVIHVEAEGQSAFAMRATLETWRKGQQVLPSRVDRIVWLQRNESSIWRNNLEHQGLAAFLTQAHDPLLHRTFGGQIEGTDFVTESDTALRTRAPGKRFALAIHPLCVQTETAEAWEQTLGEQVKRVQSMSLEMARQRHQDWWNAFWDRSWIRVSGFADAQILSQGYALQRWMNACGGRGASAIKFNGSIFTVNVEASGDPDFRAWGGQYWWQNTRLAYWPMLACGDFDLLESLFGMYGSMIPLLEHRTQRWFGHEGAFISEIVYPWGMLANGNYGKAYRERGPDVPPGDLLGQHAGYIRREYTASPELMAMMIDRYDYTRDERFLKEALLPACDSLLRFWDQHYKVGQDGRMVMYPAQVLETYWDARNPTPDVAGLQWVLGKLLEIPEEKVGASRREFWQKLLAKLPVIPIGELNGQRRILPAARTEEKTHNGENGDLYAVFPFRLYGVGKPDLEMARFTYQNRFATGDRGWVQVGIQAAYLGLTQDAAQDVVSRAKNKDEASRFPGFWTRHADWVPNQCHGGNLMTALQVMLMQPDGGKILLLPAWPATWDVDFKLHAPQQTVIEASVRQGKVVSLKVVPERRMLDVHVVRSSMHAP